MHAQVEEGRGRNKVATWCEAKEENPAHPKSFPMIKARDTVHYVLSLEHDPLGVAGDDTVL